MAGQRLLRIKTNPPARQQRPHFAAILTAMSELSFSQPQSERRNFTTPAIVVAVIVAIAFTLIYFFTSHRIADLAITHIAVVPEHTVFTSSSKVVGAETAEDDLYVFATVRIEDKLRLPITINGISGTLTAADDTVTHANAIGKRDREILYVTFPALKPLASAPLNLDTEIQPGGQAEGMVLLHFPLAEADWKNRKSAAVIIDTYSQGALTVEIPK
jgi:hypothetical protein